MKDQPLHIVQGQKRTPVITLAPENCPPFPVEVRIVEEDNFLILNPDKTIIEPTDHPIKLMTKILELEKIPLGTVLEKGNYWQAVVYDLDDNPIFNKESISLALKQILKLASFIYRLTLFNRYSTNGAQAHPTKTSNSKGL